MQSTSNNRKLRKNIENKAYLMMYTKHLEKKLRDLETKRQLIYEEKMRLEKKR